MNQQRKNTMTVRIREAELVTHIDRIADAIQWPDGAFTLSPWEAFVGVLVTFYEAFATPDRVMLRHARNGIAF